MRITIDDDDPGELLKPGQERIKVCLNGNEVPHCITADDEKGEVVTVVQNESGYVVTEAGDVKRETLYGSVIIERKPV